MTLHRVQGMTQNFLLSEMSQKKKKRQLAFSVVGNAKN